MRTDKRFIIAHREACWAVMLTIIYLVAWILTAYLPDGRLDWTGFPHWFTLSCLILPVIFITLCWVMVRFLYTDIPLGDNDAD